MTEPKPVQEAEAVARRLFDLPVERSGVPTLAEFDSAINSFAEVVFDVPPASDSDGFLFQYGLADWLPTPMFVLGITRQLEIADDAGEHESYLQVNFEYRYSPADVGKVPDPFDEWWFSGDGRSFSEWYAAVRENSIWNSLALVLPTEFSIAQDVV